MHIDVQDILHGTQIDTDVCIIGAGAAGITIARQVAQRGIGVLLLESGGFAPDSGTQDLYRGSHAGWAAHFGAAGAAAFGNGGSYLRYSRLRYLGGTTNHWEGLCVPLDEGDFERREWVDFSGWPFSSSEISRHYKNAAEVLEIDPEGVESLPKQPSLLTPSIGGMSRQRLLQSPVRFLPAYRDQIETSPRIKLITGANVTALSADANGLVSKADVSSLTGRRFNVGARRFVLACGAVENARLLLHSKGPNGVALGNQYDLVGRFFAEHPYVRLGTVQTSSDLAELRHVPVRRKGRSKLLYSTPMAERPDRLILRPTFAAQKEKRMLNFIASLRSRNTPRSKFAKRVESRHGVFLDMSGLVSGPAENFIDIALICEQAPNPVSRVSLTDDRDALGMRRVNLDMQMTALDERLLADAGSLLARELALKGLGRVCLLSETHQDAANIFPSFHHHGTTRAHSDPKQGVVDANLRVHGMKNLYVGGSSVFPTSGASNPTLTIVALAMRLAEHLENSS